eukprot:scaffold119317_cov34-Prasinocladus_malaysianus.AAC.1
MATFVASSSANPTAIEGLRASQPCISQKAQMASYVPYRHVIILHDGSAPSADSERNISAQSADA